MCISIAYIIKALFVKRISNVFESERSLSFANPITLFPTTGS